MIGVLVSGEGTNLQALLDAGLPVVAVASNRGGAPALARASCATAAFELSDFPDREARDAAMADWLERVPELVDAVVAMDGRLYQVEPPVVRQHDVHV